MSIVRNMSSVVVGLLPLLAGCGQLGDALDDEDLGVARLAEGGETSKPNGLDPDSTEACATEIMDAMKVPLVLVNGTKLIANPALDDRLATSCLEPFQYAVRCALENGATVPQHDVMGEGILSTTAPWRKAGGLSFSQTIDVLSCMTAFNNTNEQIPICLQGKNIKGAPGSCDDYVYAEAVFLTVPDTVNDGYNAFIWPLFPTNSCDAGVDVEEMLRQRVCGHLGTAQTSPCHAVLRNDYGTACSEFQGEITCLGQQAIKTHLTAAGFETMYPGCAVPVQ